MRHFAAIALLALTTAGWAQNTAQPASSESPVVVETIDDTRLAAELEARRGKIVVLNMWATWCPPCVAEFPDLIRFANEVDPDQVAVIAISNDFVSDLESKVIPFVEEQRPPFPVFLQDQHYDIFFPAVDPDWSGVFPHTVIYDAAGNISSTMGVFHSTAPLHEAVDQAASPGG